MDVVGEFQRQLDEWADTYADRPRAHLRELWLVGLEREKLVTVAYNPRIIRPRLERMGVPEGIREQVVRAIGWAWRDEEMHALYIRGTLLHNSSLPERMRTWMTQASGQVAGWTSSRQQHYRWREAPLTRSVAELIEFAGALGGQIPDGARDHLHFDSFKAFCTFSVAAETTAAMGWKRMAEVGLSAGIDAGDITAFQRMQADEERHAAIFALLADCFTDEDSLNADVTAQSLTERIGSVGQRFLATPEDGAVAWKNPLGKGAPVIVHTASPRHTAEQVMADTLDRLGLDDIVQAHRPTEGPFRVAIRATFMHGVRTDDMSPVVSPELLAALCTRLADAGAQVSVVENGNLYDRFHRGRSVLNVAKTLGFSHPSYRVLDVSQELVQHPYVRGQDREHISETWRDAHLRIVFAKLRSHPTTEAMLTLEGVEGLCGRHDDTLWAERKADRTTASLMVLDAFPPDLALLDAWRDVPDGLVGMMGSAHPKQPLRLYASTDALSLDRVVARHTFTKGDGAHRLIDCAIDWFGDPSASLTVIGDDTPISGWQAPDAGRFDRLMTRLAEPVFVHASGRGAVFVPPMDTVAFPEVSPPSPALRMARQLVFRTLGHRFPDEAQPELLPTRMLSVMGRQVRTAVIGSGPPVVLLHGYPDTLHIAGRLASALAADHQVFLFDWPGTGKSEAWPGNLTPNALADRLRHILDAFGLERVTLVAADMGGPPALCAAARFPERVERVVVMNSLLYADAPTSPEIAIMRRAGLSTLAFMTSPRVVYRQCKNTFLPGGWTLPAPLDDDLWQAFSDTTVRRTLARMCRHYERVLHKLPPHYARITCPVLALWASDEHHFDKAHAERLVAHHDNRQLRIVQGATHWMQWTHAERVARMIREFADSSNG